VFQSGDDLGFALKAGAEGRVMQEFTWQHLNSYVTLEKRVVGAQHNRHPSTSQQCFDLVATDFAYFCHLAPHYWQKAARE
jgi:hypothetical protein